MLVGIHTRAHTHTLRHIHMNAVIKLCFLSGVWLNPVFSIQLVRSHIQVWIAFKSPFLFVMRSNQTFQLVLESSYVFVPYCFSAN